MLAVRGLLRSPPWDALPEQMDPWVIYPYRVVIPARVLQRRDDGGTTMLGVRIAQPRTLMLDQLRAMASLVAPGPVPRLSCWPSSC